MQVLIVDDHPGVRALIRELLVPVLGDGVTEGGVRYVECDSGEEALAAADAAGPVLATVDLRMGGMDGLECVRQLRARFPAACLLLVTQADGARVRSRARAAGADGFVQKDDLRKLPVLARLLCTGATR